MAEWTEGVCSDGAAILRDGELMSIGDVVAALNHMEELKLSVSADHRPFRRFSFPHEWYLGGVRLGPGEYVVMRVSAATGEQQAPF